ncbi:MAG: DUF108 domain-containing protein [Candidatus Omnitrophica bacterium]|nr:DUF108 domain-containing protein [Candidatus Omnitrophota bacterium]
MVPVGLIGCGTIGSQLARAVERTYRSTARLIALHDVDETRARALQRRLANHPSIVSRAELIRRSRLVLEAASADVAASVALAALRANHDVLIMSVGGLLGRRAWQRAARRSRGRVYLPSGALAAVDGLKALAIGRITRLALTTRKPPKALMSAPYIRRKRLRLDRLKRPLVIFEGSAAAVVNAFPQNTNIAATLTLAAAKHAATPRIRVVADPTIRVNRHELEVDADCGSIRCQIESAPSANPKTSELAVRSAVATLGRIFDRVHIGT